MQAEEKRQRLLSKANELPLCPGVYMMRDRGGKVIYVGKSAKLKNRVSQYFQNSEKNAKTARMVSLVDDFDFYLCDNEIEALSLENTLIKQYTPKYNIRLKDAKSYPYIKLTKEEYPRLVFTRSRGNDKAKYFGPFSGSGTAYALIELINRVLRLPSCKRSFPRDIGKGRPCIYYQMNRCAGLCTGQISAEEYRDTVKYAVDILNGKTDQVKKQIEQQMYDYAEAERFEAAASCRDTLAALASLGDKQKVVASPDTEQDVVALYSDDFCSCVSVFYVRSGVLQDKAEFLYGADSILEPEDLTTFLCEHYKNREFIPRSILLSSPVEEGDLEMLSEYLSTIAGYRVRVRCPERGQNRVLCEMVERNAAEKAKRYRLDSEQDEDVLLRLAQLLQLESYPSRIEAYDISNLGKEHLTAGMIVCNDGRFSKSDYRSFHIRSVSGTTDDYGSMRETLSRRLEHLSDAEGSFAAYPDLILLDGGRGHVSVIKELLAQKGLEIPVFGMVKDDYHKTRALCTDTQEISIAKEREIYSLIYRIQEEVHRYTVGRMETAKRKTVKTSVLTGIPGIGEAKAKKLLKVFGCITRVKNASCEELEAVSGISHRDAVAVWEYYHKATKDKNKEAGEKEL